MTGYTTIPVPRSVREKLEKAKGKESWGSFLLKLYKAYEESKRKKAFDELTNMLSEEELAKMEESYKEFRKRFRVRA